MNSSTTSARIVRFGLTRKLFGWTVPHLHLLAYLNAYEEQDSAAVLKHKDDVHQGA